MKLGLIINPIAGVGGTLGLKGTDGERAEIAWNSPKCFYAGQRATTALSALRPFGDRVSILTGAGEMGAEAARRAGLRPTLLQDIGSDRSEASDTLELARRLVARDVDLIAFAGGDGTARDILSVVGTKVPVVGIPAGVKIHSAVFATSPRTAGEVIVRYLSPSDRPPRLRKAEVLDRPEGEPDQSPMLYGVMRVPVDAVRVQSPKAVAPVAEDGLIDAACAHLARRFQDDVVSIIGPGTTMQSFKRALGHSGTLLGVDLFTRGRPIALDVDEMRIREYIAGRRSRIVLGVVGGQGFLLGRGNQQISPAIIRATGRDNIFVIASPAKLTALPRGRLLIDSGDAALDVALAGHLPVQVSATQTMMMRLDAA